MRRRFFFRSDAVSWTENLLRVNPRFTRTMSILKDVVTVYALAWAPMVFIAIANGIVRQSVYGPSMNELTAHQISTVTIVLLFGFYIWSLTRIWRIPSTRQAISIGLIWLALTIAFEFLFGHFVAGHTWSRLLHDYNILDGRLWFFVLLWITVAPYLFFRFGRRQGRPEKHETGAGQTH
jgi:hypothetical protein